MKKIKLFENFLNESKRELKEFCDINLAYLIDEDFDISISTFPGGYIINFSRERGFIWNEITDQFIPFLERLSNDYTFDLAMISFNERFPQSHESKMVRPQSLMNHEVMLDFLGDTLLRKIMIRIIPK